MRLRGAARERSQRVLDREGIAYTGSNPLTLAVALHKHKAKEILRGRGVPTPEAIHLTTYFRKKGFKAGQFPVSERIARETVSLPLVPDMARADVERVCAAMGRVLRRKAA